MIKLEDAQHENNTIFVNNKSQTPIFDNQVSAYLN